MDSSIVNKEIKRVVWPFLRRAGFTHFTARYAWRYAEHQIDVVNFQSFNSYLAERIRCTTYSFALNLGISFNAIPTKRTVERREGQLRPKEWECHFRLHPGKHLEQPEFPRRNIWFVDSSGQNVAAVVEDAEQVIGAVALPWFEKYRDQNEVLQTLLEQGDSPRSGDAHDIGRNPSPIRHLLTGYIALAQGKTALSIPHLEAVLLSRSFEDLKPEIRRTLAQLLKT